MADDINRINVTGRLTKDSELRYTGGGKPVLGFSIAVNRSVKRNNNWESAAWFFDVTVWGKRGETLVNHLKKGTKVTLEGHLRQDSFEQDGYRRTRVLIELNQHEKLVLMDGDNRGGSGSTGQRNSPKGSGKQRPQGKDAYQDYTPPSDPGRYDGYEDDIPF